MTPFYGVPNHIVMGLLNMDYERGFVFGSSPKTIINQLSHPFRIGNLNGWHCSRADVEAQSSSPGPHILQFPIRFDWIRLNGGFVMLAIDNNSSSPTPSRPFRLLHWSLWMLWSATTHTLTSEADYGHRSLPAAAASAIRFGKVLNYCEWWFWMWNDID